MGNIVAERWKMVLEPYQKQIDELTVENERLRQGKEPLIPVDNSLSLEFSKLEQIVKQKDDEIENLNKVIGTLHERIGALNQERSVATNDQSEITKPVTKKKK